MGGNAFRAILTTSIFPRMPPAVYLELKTRLIPKLRDLYTYVAVPFEAPEKLDYGDIDFNVAIPKRNYTSEHLSTSPNVPHEVTLRALGATHMVPMDGNRTSHFAVPIKQGEWGILGHGKEEEETRLNETGELFYQVDVHVCSDVSEWERILFFHSYGDFQMILADVLKSGGLKFGEKGLHLPITGHPPMKLSDSVDDIMQFIGLSMERWRAGFSTKQEIFEWVGTSHFFGASALNIGERPGARKVKPDRKMYRQFVEWVEDRRAISAKSTTDSDISDQEDGQQRRRNLQEEALDFFGKHEEFNALRRELEEKSVKEQARKSFNGTIVGEWTNLTGRWLIVKQIMDKVRERVGGDQAALQIIRDHGEDTLKAIVIEVANELSTMPSGAENDPVEALSASVDNVSLDSSARVIDPVKM